MSGALADRVRRDAEDAIALIKAWQAPYDARLRNGGTIQPDRCRLCRRVGRTSRGGPILGADAGAWQAACQSSARSSRRWRA